MRLVTDLAIIAKISKQKYEENFRFRSFLKGYDGPEEEIEAAVHSLYQRISSEIDCRRCASCCRKIQPALSHKEILTFTNGLGLNIDEFKTKYIIQGESPGEFRFIQGPCPFLKDNLCTNYEYRPGDCQSYPHLHKDYFTVVERDRELCYLPHRI